MSLVDSAPASLELLDIAGRRIWSSDISSPSRGLREVSLESLPRTGLYFLRLTQGPRTTSTKSLHLRR
ncbi:MAG TPA: T9SS type A sorting domain-containing protein [Candidatus Limnocylindria bacterium]|nr:T9SS type A sorting domain-containing protein [Candidatus Limnocylindria bacterium]